MPHDRCMVGYTTRRRTTVAGRRPTATDPTTTAAAYPRGATTAGGHQIPTSRPAATATVVAGATRWRHRSDLGCIPSTTRFQRPYWPNWRANVLTDPRGRYPTRSSGSNQTVPPARRSRWFSS